jgi:hypothetical protein
VYEYDELINEETRQVMRAERAFHRMSELCAEGFREFYPALSRPRWYYFKR